MKNINGRRCVATKKVQTANGVARRCARYEETGADVEHRATSFGDFANALNWNVDVTDLAIGAAAGLAGVGAVKYAVGKFLPGKLPEIAVQALPALSGALVGAGLYFAQGGSARAKGHAVGAAAAGVAVNAWDVLKGQFPALADAWTYSLPYGYVVPEKLAPGMPGQFGGGLSALIDDPRPGMSELAALSIGDEEDNAP